LFSLYFGAPIFGAHNFEKFYTETLGCSVAFQNAPECVFFGFDYANLAILYHIPFLNLLFTPIAYVVAFLPLLIIWVITVLVFRHKRNNSD